jgi:hypothetical protein
MAPQLLRVFGVGIAALTARIETALAEKAFAAGNGEGNDDPVADLQFLFSEPSSTTSPMVSWPTTSPLFIDGMRPSHMQVRAADRATGHLDNGIARMFDLEIGDSFTSHIVFAVPTESLHGIILEMISEKQCLTCKRGNRKIVIWMTRTGTKYSQDAACGHVRAPRSPRPNRRGTITAHRALFRAVKASEGEQTTPRRRMRDRKQHRQADTALIPPAA